MTDRRERFEAPSPIRLQVDIPRGRVSVTATNAAITNVELMASSGDADALAWIAQATITRADNEIIVRGPDLPFRFFRGGSGKIEARIEAPVGSDAILSLGDGPIETRGKLGKLTATTGSGMVKFGDCDEAHAKTDDGKVDIGRVTGSVDAETGSGHVRVAGIGASGRIVTGDGDVDIGEVTGSVEVDSGSGDVTIGPIGGDARIATGDGDVELGQVRGSVNVETGSGDVTIEGIGAKAHIITGDGDAKIGAVGGSAKCSTSDGNIDVASAGDSLDLYSDDGDIDVRRAERGLVRARTMCGSVSVGVANGVAALLDLSAPDGRVHSDLSGADGPSDGEAHVELKLSSESGDVAVVRA